MKCSVVLLGFLTNYADELSPRCIVDRPRQPLVFNQPRDVEVLDVDNLILANQRQGLLVVIIATSTRNFTMLNRDLAPALVPVDRFLLSSGLFTLQSSQLAELPSQISRVRYVRAFSIGVRDRRQPQNTYIDPGLAVHHRQWGGRNLDNETSVKLPIGLADDRDRRWFAW
jgi:hypothetical protein